MTQIHPSASSTEIRIDPGHREHQLKHQLEHQTSQIVENLRVRKKKIEEQEAEFRLRVWNWESSAATQQAKMQQQQSRLQQKEIELRQLQTQMLELQNQIIESQLTLQGLVNQIAQPHSRQEQIDGLETLRKELNERFDVVAARWTQIVNEMRLLASQITDAVSGPVKIEL